MPLESKLDHHMHSLPDQAAYVINNTHLTYRCLRSNADKIAYYLNSLPAQRNAYPLLNNVKVLVALCVGNHSWFPQWFAASTRFPFAAAIIDPYSKSDQIKEVFQKLNPDLVVIRRDDTHITEIANKLRLKTIFADEAPAVEDGQHRQGYRPAKETLYDDVFLVNFTSGTTSVPKAFTRSRPSWEKSLITSQDYFETRIGQKTMCPAALSHGLALYALAETLYSGGTFYGVENWDPALVSQQLLDHQIERFVGVPTMITALEKQSPTHYPSITDVVTAGAKLTAQNLDVMRQLFPNARLREYYGASELGFVSVSTLYPSQQPNTITSVGAAFPGVGLTIKGSNANGNQNGNQSEPGTIYVESKFICDGYLWGDDGHAFRVDELGATVGDIGKIDPNGDLTVLGREGGMVITGGHNVYPSEVESALKSIAGVEDVVVLGLDDDYLGKVLVAVIMVNVKLDQLIKEASLLLPRYKVPRRFYEATDWPMTNSRKIARGQVEKNLEDGLYEQLQLSA